MKIGITIPHASVNYSGGINVQARMWRDGLVSLGHMVDLLTPWDKFDYENYDFIIILGYGKLVADFVRLYKQFKNIKIVSAPILDPNDIPLWKFKLLKYYGSERLKLHSHYHDYYRCKDDFCLFLARSEYEKKYIVEGFNIEADRVKIVPISMRFDNVPDINLSMKADSCLHVSRLFDTGKNVKRLIEAAKKYGFSLRLAGTIHGPEEQKWLDDNIGEADNIKYIGWLSEEDLREEYKMAKVFALPSIIEGVGMVALEAAVYGCEICLTELGGPKEYYNGRAVLVNPYDVDSIGNGVMEAMSKKNSQPELSQFVMQEYSVVACMRKLECFLLEVENKGV